MKEYEETRTFLSYCLNEYIGTNGKAVGDSVIFQDRHLCTTKKWGKEKR